MSIPHANAYHHPVFTYFEVISMGIFKHMLRSRATSAASRGVQYAIVQNHRRYLISYNILYVKPLKQLASVPLSDNTLFLT